MRIITLPFGFVMKFDSVADLRTHIGNLQGMVEWSEGELRANRPVRLAYAVYEDEGKSEEIKEILAELPYIKECVEIVKEGVDEILGVVVESRKRHR